MTKRMHRQRDAGADVRVGSRGAFKNKHNGTEKCKRAEIAKSRACGAAVIGDKRAA